MLQKGIYLSESKDVARDYAGEGGKIYKYKVDKKAKVLNLTDGEMVLRYMLDNGIIDKEEINSDLENYILSGRLFQYDPYNRTGIVDDLLATAKSQGYDVVRLYDDLDGKSNNIATVVINKGVIKPSEGVEAKKETKPEAIAKDLGLEYIGKQEGMPKEGLPDQDLYNVKVGKDQATFTVPTGADKATVKAKAEEVKARFEKKPNVGEKPPDEFSDRAIDFVDKEYLGSESDSKMYHVTTAKSKVLSEGLKSRKETKGIGLGGGITNQAPDKVSVTFDEAQSQTIADRLKLAVKAARGKASIDEILDSFDMLSDDTPRDFAEALHAPEETYDDWDLFNQWVKESYKGKEYELLAEIDDALPELFPGYEGHGLRVGLTGAKEQVAKIDPKEIDVLNVSARKGAKAEHIPDEAELRFKPEDVWVNYKPTAKEPTKQITITEQTKGGTENAGEIGKKAAQAGEQAQKLEQEKKGRLHVRDNVSARMAPGQAEGRGGSSENGKAREVEKKAEKPWQLTKKEYDQYSKQLYDKLGNKLFANTNFYKYYLEASLELHQEALREVRKENDRPHYIVIARALQEGKVVPKEILKDYPQLVKKQEVSQKGWVNKEEESLIKDAWKMPEEEYVGKMAEALWKQDPYYFNKPYDRWESAHRQTLSNIYESHIYYVKQALKEGKPVPVEVLKDYPDLAKQYVGENLPLTISKEEFIKSPPKGYRYNPKLHEEANVHEEKGYITVGPKFFKLSPGERKTVINHEKAHSLESSFSSSEWNDAFKYTDQGILGPVGKNEMIDGVHSPGERITDIYASLLDGEPRWTTVPLGGYKKVAELAKKKGFPVNYRPDEVFRKAQEEKQGIKNNPVGEAKKPSEGKVSPAAQKPLSTAEMHSEAGKTVAEAINKLPEGDNPADIGKEFAKKVKAKEIAADEADKIVSALKIKQDAYNTRQTKLLKEREAEIKNNISEGFSDIMDSFGGKLSLTGEKRAKAIEGLTKVAKGLVDLGTLHVKELERKLRLKIKEKVFDARKRNQLYKLIRELDLGKILRETQQELRERGMDPTIALLNKGLDDINFVVKEDKENAIETLNRKDTRLAYVELVRKRRAWIDIRNLNAGILSHYLRTYMPKVIRELVPFIVEKTDIPKNLGRPDLEKAYEENKAEFEKGGKYYEAVQKIKSFYHEYFQQMVDHLDMTTDREIEDFINRIWDIPKKKLPEVTSWFRTTTEHTNKRLIETVKEGVDEFNIKPKTLDIAELIPIYAQSINNAVANSIFVDAVKLFHRAGQPMLLPASKAPPGWITTDHPALRGWVFKGEKDGNAFMAYENMKAHPDLASFMNRIFGKRITLPVHIFGADRDLFRGYEMGNMLLKKSWLSLSFFHPIALTQSLVAKLAPKRVPKDFATPFYYMLNPQKGTPVQENPELARRAIQKGGVQFGSTSDYDVNRIQNALDRFAEINKNIPLLKWVTKGFAKFNKAWDKGLWNYLHDGFKLYAWYDIEQRAPKNMTKAEEDKYYKEQGAYINDAFGGQNWDLLMMSPKIRQILNWGFLSMDWTISTFRQALGVMGIGKVDRSEPYFKQLLTKKSGVNIRAKEATTYWLKGMVIFGVGLNMLNIYHRKKDRKENPQYYVDKPNSFWDNTMFNNTIGHKTHVFVGRYNDGSEKYQRSLKQFREVPELIIDKDGISFPKPMLKKLAGKAAPLPTLFVEMSTGRTPSGYDDWDLKDKKGWDWTFGLLKTLAKGPVPFAFSDLLRGDKEWTPANLLMPFNKGMTKSQAIQAFKKGIDVETGQIDEDYMRQIYEMAVRNNLPAFDLEKLGLANARMEYIAKVKEGIRSIEDVDKAIAEATSPLVKKKLQEKKKRMQHDIDAMKEVAKYYKYMDDYFAEQERKFALEKKGETIPKDETFSNEMRFLEYREQHPKQFELFKKNKWIPTAYTRKKHILPRTDKKIEFTDDQIKEINNKAFTIYAKRFLANKEYYSSLSKDKLEERKKAAWSWAVGRAVGDEYRKIKNQ